MENRSANIIMMHGYTCSLKTTISKALAENMGLDRLETKQFGKIVSQEGKSVRYQLFAAYTQKYVDRGRSIILDGTFGKKEYRDQIYRIAHTANLEDVVVIHCYCDDETEVIRRIDERGKNESNCDWLSIDRSLTSYGLSNLSHSTTYSFSIDVENTCNIRSHCRN